MCVFVFVFGNWLIDHSNQIREKGVREIFDRFEMIANSKEIKECGIDVIFFFFLSISLFELFFFEIRAIVFSLVFFF